MKPFTGFSTDRQKTVRVPEGFFEDVLPSITSMLEMKVILYLFWRLARGGANGASPRMLNMEELASDDKLKATLAQVRGPRPFDEALREGVDLCVARGTLLQLWVRQEVASYELAETGKAEPSMGNGHRGELSRELPQWYLLNTRDNRAWVEGLANGQIDVSHTPLASHNSRLATPIRVIVERPNVYTLYEQNIGLLTPLLAEKLQDAEGRYPMDWIEAAFEEAVTNNKRSWRYIERILERWAAEGKGNGKDRGPAERSLDPDKYTKGKYAFLFRPDRP